MWGASYQRPHLLSQPFPSEWGRYLRANMAHYGLLSGEERARLQDDARVLVAEKNWEGCGGLVITDEIKLTIAAQAALLLLGIKHDYFKRVLSVLVYPSGFRIPGGEWMDESETGTPADGQAVYRGPVILGWDAVRAEAADPSQGHNVVIHEFTHQLDFLDGESNGAPMFDNREQGDRWHAIMTEAFERHCRRIDNGRRTFLGDYAAECESEFFAVLSERFYTVPDRLRRHHAELYDLLREYYGVDPSRWFQHTFGEDKKGYAP